MHILRGLKPVVRGVYSGAVPWECIADLTKASTMLGGPSTNVLAKSAFDAKVAA